MRKVLLSHSLWKVLLFALFGYALHMIPVGGKCVDGVGFGYCITYRGFPFQIVTGEIANMPASHREGVLFKGLVGGIANLLILWLVLSGVQWIVCLLRRQRS